MTYYISALENTKARLIANKATLMGCDAEAAVALLKAAWEAAGYIVIVEIEG